MFCSPSQKATIVTERFKYFPVIEYGMKMGVLAKDLRICVSLVTICRSLICLMLILAPITYAKERNITEKVVFLKAGAIKVRFHNMGVDANWGKELLENTAKALPVLEDLIGVNFPSDVETVEIYGIPEKEWKGYGWAVGINQNGTQILMREDHPNPTNIYHELVHFWTTHYNVPHALIEGYCVLYSYLVAKHFGENVVAYDLLLYHSVNAFESEIKNNIRLIKTDNPKAIVALNSFDYGQELDEKKIDYFYGMSSAIMFELAGVFEENDAPLYGIGIERLKELNRMMMSSQFDSTISGVGTLQYIELLRQMTGKTMTDPFLPVFFTTWNDSTRTSFAKTFSYLSSAKIITGTSSSTNIDTGMRELATGNIDGATNYFNLAIKTYYESLVSSTPPPTPPSTEAPPTGMQKLLSLTKSPWFLSVLLIFFIVVIFSSLGIYLYFRAKKEEEFSKYMEEIRNE